MLELEAASESWLAVQVWMLELEAASERWFAVQVWKDCRPPPRGSFRATLKFEWLSACRLLGRTAFHYACFQDPAVALLVFERLTVASETYPNPTSPGITVA